VSAAEAAQLAPGLVQQGMMRAVEMLEESGVHP
jgi:hypothetical protein